MRIPIDDLPMITNDNRLRSSGIERMNRGSETRPIHLEASESLVNLNSKLSEEDKETVKRISEMHEQ